MEPLAGPGDAIDGREEWLLANVFLALTRDSSEVRLADMPITPQYRQEGSKRSSVFIGLGAAWVVLVVLGFSMTLLSAVLRLPGAMVWGVVLCASVVAGVFAARVHARGR